MVEEFSPFEGIKSCPLLFDHPEVFSKLPNYGIYSIRYNPDSKPKVRKRAWIEETEPVAANQLMYSWKTSISRKWRSLCKRDLIYAGRVNKGDTLQFLLETQKYIHSIRKPNIITTPVPPSPPLLLEEAKKPAELRAIRPRTKAKTYSVKYFGEVNGGIGIMTKKVPMSRPATSRPLISASVSTDAFWGAKVFSSPPSRVSPRMRVQIPHIRLDDPIHSPRSDFTAMSTPTEDFSGKTLFQWKFQRGHGEFISRPRTSASSRKP